MMIVPRQLYRTRRTVFMVPRRFMFLLVTTFFGLILRKQLR